jgi:hypothetical protein
MWTNLRAVIKIDGSHLQQDFPDLVHGNALLAWQGHAAHGSNHWPHWHQTTRGPLADPHNLNGTRKFLQVHVDEGSK